MDVGQEDAATGSIEQNLLAKGKRTKRQRLQISVSLIAPNPNFTEPDSELFGQRHSEGFHPTRGKVCNFSLTPSNGGDDDEEDMANCLILLAQGRPASEATSSSSFRRFMEATEDQNGAGKAVGCCVYECKTCSRTFPSFQALGGHRASHKKPLKPADDKKPISELTRENEEDEEEFKNNISNPVLEHRLSRSDCYNKLVNKVHECSICGAEFMSGQALGGHMRRHRRGLGTGGGASSSGSMAIEEAGEMERPTKQKSLLSLDLDLNLPAPEDGRKEQSGAIVMAAPALVGCHY